MKIPRHFALAAALLLTATPASAEIIGVEQFDYPDGAIAGTSGGTFWDYKNTSPVGHGGVASTWDNLAFAPQVTAGRLVTSGNGAVKREYRGANETEGAVNDANVAKQVFYRVTVTTGPSVSAADYFGISSMDFGTEKIYFGKRGGSATWGVEEVGAGGTNGSASIQPNTTYTLVAIVDFVNDFIRLYVNPDLNGPQPGPGSAAATRAYTGTNWSTAVRFAAGTAVTWDDLVVATEWADLNTTVTTTADEDHGNLVGNVSLREAVKYSPGGFVSFAPALSGQAITLTHGDGDMLIPSAVVIDASNLSGGLTVSGNGTSRHFHVESGKSLTLRGLTLTAGKASGHGGAILNDGSLQLDRCVLKENAASTFGGAISSTGTLQATDCAFSENCSDSVGGGIMLFSGMADLSRCTLSGNTALSGGALYQQGASPATLAHCTVAGNRSTGGFSTGGIAAVAGTLNLQHCTISQNTGSGGGGGLLLQAPATANVQFCIIAGNTDPSGPGPDISHSGGTLSAVGNCVIGNNNTAQATFPAGTFVGTAASPLDPKLSPLGDFGGRVPTMHPLVGSPAIENGSTINPGGTDARGFPRFVDSDANGTSAFDLGAVEAGIPIIVNNAGDSAGNSLRNAFIIISATTEPGYRVVFDPAVFPASTIILADQQIIAPAGKTFFVDASNISGGVAISGNHASRVFTIPPSTNLTIHSLRIENGDAGNQAGGGIRNDGTCTVISSTFSGNSGGFGGGIDNTGRCAVTSSTFNGNSASDQGGGIYNGGTCTVTSSTFGGNTATNTGGGIHNEGSCSLRSSTLSGNTAHNDGGGIFQSTLSLANTRIESCIVAGNTAPTNANISGATSGSNNLTSGDPMLLPPGNYGGPTPTMPLRNNSPARDAAGPVNEMQQVNIGALPLSFTLSFKGATTTTLDHTSTASQVQSALAALSTIGAGHVNVTRTVDGGGNTLHRVTFTGSLAGSDQPPLTASSGPAITTLTQGDPGSRLTTDQRGFARLAAPDIGAFEAQLSSIADITIELNTTTGPVPFTVGQVGALIATADNPTLLPAGGIGLGGSGANRTITLTPAANRYGTTAVTLTDTASGETLTFTVTVTAIEVTSSSDTDPGSLRQALADAAARPGADFITFAPGLSGQTITLGSELVINDANPVTIDATTLPGGLTLSGGKTTRHFQVFGGKSLTLRGLTLTLGYADGDGGAIYSQGTLTGDRCTFYENASAFNGGAIGSLGALALTHCTFSGNSANRVGGAIFNNQGTCEVNHCSLSGNSARLNGGGIWFRLALTLSNSLIAGNAASIGPDIYQSSESVTPTGVNFIGNLAGSGLTASPTVITGDARLSPLGHFGGPVPTLHPLIGSPAIDAAGTMDPGSSDARGFPRFVDGDANGTEQLDIGAVEAGPLTTVVIHSDSGGTTALRSRIAAAAGIPGARIGFLASSFPGTITLNGTQLTFPATPGLFIDASDIPGAGVTVSGNNLSRVFDIPATATVAMHSLKIVNGNNSSDDLQNGGGILNTGTCTVMSSTLSGNFSSYDGGGIHNTGLCTVLDSCFIGNEARANGGGIANNFATCTVRSSTFSGNTAQSINLGGGGIYNAGTCTVLASTFGGNTTNGYGGGVFSRLGTCTVLSSTLSGNSALVGGGGIFNQGSFILGSSIVAGNTAPVGPDVDGFVAPGPNNLFGPNNPLLAPLGNYGGPTQTMPPLRGSPAIDGGSATTAQADQRGFSRSRDGDGDNTAAPDIGAVEASLVAVTTTADADPGSLRAALTEAAAQPGPDTVYFTHAVTAPVTLGSEIVITDPDGVTVDASDRPTGVVIDGGPGANRHFRIETGGVLTLQRLRLTGGNGGGGGSPASYGGSIHNGGSLDVRECTFDGNASGIAGAIYNQSGALTVERSTFHGNTASNVGAILHESLTPMLITASTFTNNNGGFEGGAITVSNFRPATISHCTISGNRVPNAGGGGGGGIRTIAGAGNLLTLNYCIVTGNTDANSPGVANAAPGPGSAPNLLSGNARLAPLGDYGGPTPTMALRPGSPALNAVAASTATTDQRGFGLVGVKDLGAYEAGNAYFADYNAYIWETLPSTATPPETVLEFDYDGDGTTNELEWLALTNAASATSVFRPTLTRASGVLELFFPTVAGRVYLLQHSDTLDPFSWITEGVFTGIDGIHIWTVPVDGPRRFYRVSVTTVK